MPTSVGPNTYGEENLVFGYDLGDVSNSYKGEPTVNLLTSADDMTGTGWSLGNVSSEITITGNQPDPFGKNNALLFTVAANGGNYPHIRQIDKITGTTASHTISIWAKSVSGSTRLDLVCFRSSPWNTAFSKTVTLTAEWQKFEVTGTPLDTTGHRIYFMCQNVPSGTATQVLMAYPQVEQKSHATPFTTGTRSATQGLIDLTGNSTIDLSNVSFDSNAQMTFDGTNDYVNIDTVPSAIANLDQGTIEIVFKWEGSGGNATLFYIGDITEPALEGQFYIWVGDTTGASSAEGIRILFRNASNQTLWDKYEAMNSSTYFRDGEYHHLVITQNGSAPRVYIDNVDITANLINWTSPTNEGAFFSAVNCTRMLLGHQYYGGVITGDTPLNGGIPMLKIYNRALTASEVASNYKAIKGRFNI